MIIGEQGVLECIALRSSLFWIGSLVDKSRCSIANSPEDHDDGMFTTASKQGWSAPVLSEGLCETRKWVELVGSSLRPEVLFVQCLLLCSASRTRGAYWSHQCCV